MGKVSITELPSELREKGIMLQEEMDLVWSNRANKIINDIGGEDRSGDGKRHPFASYDICRKPIVVNGETRLCNTVHVGELMALEHALSHNKK